MAELANIGILDHCLSLQNALLNSFSSSLTDRRAWASTPDRRLPLEVWEKICEELYPSQLCRLSQVSRSLYIYVGSLKVWEKWFNKSQGHFRQKLQLFAEIPRERTHMRYMCAISLLVCEGCGQMSSLWDVGAGPPWQNPLPWRTCKTSPARVRMCAHCRRASFDPALHNEPVPRRISSSFLTKSEIIEKYDDVGVKIIKSLTQRTKGLHGKPVRYNEGELWRLLCERKVGNVGMMATYETARLHRMKTWARLYSLLMK